MRVMLVLSLLLAGCSSTSSSGPTVQHLQMHGPVTVDFAGLDVSGWVKGANGLTVDVESAPGPLDGKKSAMITDRKKAAVDKNGHFRVKLKMVDGENCVSVKFQGTRIGGMSILVDNSAPYILITEPLDKHKTKEGTVKVKGIVRDSHLVSVDVDGVAAKVTGETFEAEVPVPVIGKNYVTANAYDSAGNVGNFQMRVYREE